MSSTARCTRRSHERAAGASRSIVGSNGANGLQHLEATKDLSAGVGGAVVAVCPGGKKILGVSGDWTASVRPTATSINPNLNSGAAYGFNDTDGTKTLRVTATCALVG
ncbi:hypothetical protein [Nocardioides renjunii]|uniref:hypothetical protein n=1 Tax=Nocardioides renjunii TaxID=3095075 RepID=UPI002AFDE5AB|nr:hypothetical protein [Nocardioides sp. S-34]WQQ24491.1 hypothetical protein SHK17_10935 [Nocardioides sp. S-34]